MWLGIAKGLGVEIIIPEESHLLKAKLYGWEVTQLINRQDLEFRKNVVTMEHQRVIAELNAMTGARQELEAAFRAEKKEPLKKRLQKRGNEIYQHELNLLAKANAMGGRLQEINDLLAYLDNMAVDGRVGLSNISTLDLSANPVDGKVNISGSVETAIVGKTVAIAPQ